MLHRIKRKLRSGLNSLGYDVHRLPVDNSTPEGAFTEESLGLARDGTGFIVEFLGPSGVGKTTLHDALVHQRDVGDGWVTVEEYLSHHDEVGRDGVSLDVTHRMLLEWKLRSVSEAEIPVQDKYQVLDFFHRNLLVDLRINAPDVKACVVWHDGLLHNFSDELRELLQHYPADFGALVRNRAVVHCHSTPEQVAAHIMQRQRDGHIRPQHKGLGETALVAYSAEGLATNAGFVRRLSEHSLACLEVDTADDISENVQRVREFVISLQRGMPPRDR